MTALGFTLFDTPIGACGLAWGERGVLGVQLPEGRETSTRTRMRKRFPRVPEAAPPPALQPALEAIAAHLEEGGCDLSAIPLDMGGVPAFHRRVYEAARAVPPGTTVSYGEIASRVGAPGAARAVGQALGRNPFAIVVPCHRVLAAGGRVGGFSADGGTKTKLRLLAIEGVQAGRSTASKSRPALAFDPVAAVAHVRAADPALARIIERVGPCRLELKPTTTLFAALAEAIVHQQLSGKAAATIFSRVAALFPRARNGFGAGDVARVSDAQLQGAGISRPKLLALRDLAARTQRGELPTFAAACRLDDAALIERLTAVRGIGPWTVQMLLIFRLGRPDVLPIDDYGLRKGLAVALRTRSLPSPADVERRGARWRPYCTVASWYLWRAAELPDVTPQRRRR